VLRLQLQQEGLVVPQCQDMVARNLPSPLRQGRHTQLFRHAPHARAVARREVVADPRGAPRAERRDVEKVCSQEHGLRRGHIAKPRFARVEEAQDDGKGRGGDVVDLRRLRRRLAQAPGEHGAEEPASGAEHCAVAAKLAPPRAHAGVREDRVLLHCPQRGAEPCVGRGACGGRAALPQRVPRSPSRLVVIGRWRGAARLQPLPRPLPAAPSAPVHSAGLTAVVTPPMRFRFLVPSLLQMRTPVPYLQLGSVSTQAGNLRPTLSS